MNLPIIQKPPHGSPCNRCSDRPRKTPMCDRCKAREVVEMAEADLREKEFRQPCLGETIDPGEIPRLKRRLARAKQQYEKVRTNV